MITDSKDNKLTPALARLLIEQLTSSMRDGPPFDQWLIDERQQAAFDLLQTSLEYN